MKKQPTLNKILIGWWGCVPTGTAPTYYQPYAGVRTAYRIPTHDAPMSIRVRGTVVYGLVCVYESKITTTPRQVYTNIPNSRGYLTIPSYIYTQHLRTIMKELNTFRQFLNENGDEGYDKASKKLFDMTWDEVRRENDPRMRQDVHDEVQKDDDKNYIDDVQENKERSELSKEIYAGMNLIDNAIGKAKRENTLDTKTFDKLYKLISGIEDIAEKL